MTSLLKFSKQFKFPGKFKFQFNDFSDDEIYNTCMSYNRFLTTDGIYHAFNRGINSTKILLSSEDKNVFISIIASVQRIYNFRLYCYSIMDNHYHLIFHDTGELMPFIIGLIQELYAKYYNAKYKRTGPVFENPFKSRIIMDEIYFFTLISYVENNPVEANIVNHFTLYPWNSEIENYSRLNLIDTEYINHLSKKHLEIPLNEFIELNSTLGQLCDIEVFHMKDDEAHDCFMKVLHSETGLNEFNPQNVSPEQLNNIIDSSYYRGVSLHQLVQFTGLSFRQVRKMKKPRIYL
jgi:REP element-mobilizing transposase RayT